MAYIHVLIAASILLSGVHSVTIDATPSVVVNLGEAVQLLCRANTNVKSCNFRSPANQPFPIFEGATFEDGRVVPYGNDKNDCGIEITNVRDSDNGQWECNVAGLNQDKSLQVRKNFVNVTVAVAPSDIYLRINGERQDRPIEQKLGEGATQINIDCVVEGARPEPEFRWYIGNTPLKATTKSSVEAGQGNKQVYVNTLTYYAVEKHDKQKLRCEVTHMGYSPSQKDSGENWAEAELKLMFQPEKHIKQTFYNMKKGVSNSIRIKFRSNPKPETGVWKIGKATVQVGTESLDRKFKSTFIDVGDMEGEYQVVLTIKKMSEAMVGKTFSLTVTNSLGSTEYQFELELSAKPPAETTNTTLVVVGVVVAILIIALVVGLILRTNGLLCFKDKKREEDTERAVDKEGSDTESAEDTTGGAGNKETESSNQQAAEKGSDSETSKKEADKKTGVVTRVSNLFAAVKKSVKKPKEGKYAADTPESEMKVPLQDGEEKKDGEKDEVTYADIDKSALGPGKRKDVVMNVEEDKTQYAEIKPQ